MTATVAVDVWIRPCDSVSGTRCTRCVPPSHLNAPNAPAPLTANVISLYPPASLELRHELAQIAVLACGREIAARLPPLLREPVRRLELLQLSSGGRRLPAIV